MKAIFSLFFVIISLLAFGSVGIQESAFKALESEFHKIEEIGTATFREGFLGCDLIVSLKARGILKRGLEAKTYECDLCLINGGNDFYDYDRDTIFCSLRQ